MDNCVFCKKLTERIEARIAEENRYMPWEQIYELRDVELARFADRIYRQFKDDTDDPRT